MLGVVTYATAQQKLYVQLRSGYGIPAANDDLGSPLTELGDGDYSLSDNGMISNKSLYGSLGKGANFGLGVGYTITDHLIAELGFAYTTGPRILDARISTPTYFAEQYSQAVGYVLAPSLIMQTAGEKIKLYLKVGASVPLGGKITTEIQAVDDDNRLVCRFLECNGAISHPSADMHVELDAEGITYGSPTIGFSSGIGVRYLIGKHVSIFSEVNMVTLTIKSKETLYTKYDIEADGDLFPGIPLDIAIGLEDFDTYETQINYVDELTENSNNDAYNVDFSTDLPMDDRAFKTNLNTLSINLGIQYNF